MNTTDQDQEDVAKRLKRMLLCPRCMGELRIVFHEDVEVDTCLTCNGIWVDIIEEKNVTKDITGSFYDRRA
ncbi:MAG: zf-TFIIB domain-containing protein [Candidatus Jettenia sp.]|nr:zf-TFIIB domain-containing protein [Candidatus Jettenia sp.]